MGLVGINREILEHIFGRFYRENKGRNTTSGRMGLGLSISQETIKQHKGRLDLTSKIEKGTKVTIKPPIK